MLFTFNYFWKALLVLIASWVFYGIWGFEFSVITLLTTMLIVQMKPRPNSQ